MQSEAKSDVSSESGSPARVDHDGIAIDYGTGECKVNDDDDDTGIEEEDAEAEEAEESMPCHGGVPARALERRLQDRKSVV